MMESTYFPSVPSLPASLPLLHVAEADLELLILQTPLPSIGIIGVHHHSRLTLNCLYFFLGGGHTKDLIQSLL